MSLFNRRETLRGTYTSNTTRCVFLMVSARKHATRRRTAYNQHRNKLRSAYVLRVDPQRQETKKRYTACLKKMSVDTYVGKTIAPDVGKKMRERNKDKSALLRNALMCIKCQLRLKQLQIYTIFYNQCKMQKKYQNHIKSY